VLGMAAALAMVVCVSPAEGAKYRGARYLLTGQGAGTWIIKTRAARGDGTVPAKIKCRPKRVCGGFAKKLRLDLVPGDATYLYTATFTLGAATCALDAYVYSEGFEGTYDCSDGDAGSISGRAS